MGDGARDREEGPGLKNLGRAGRAAAGRREPRAVAGAAGWPKGGPELCLGLEGFYVGPGCGARWGEFEDGGRQGQRESWRASERRLGDCLPAERATSR